MNWFVCCYIGQMGLVVIKAIAGHEWFIQVHKVNWRRGNFVSDSVFWRKENWFHEEGDASPLLQEFHLTDKEDFAILWRFARFSIMDGKTRLSPYLCFKKIISSSCLGGEWEQSMALKFSPSLIQVVRADGSFLCFVRAGNPGCPWSMCSAPKVPNWYELPN